MGKKKEYVQIIRGSFFNEVGDLLTAGDIDAARALLPAEGPYPLPAGSVICD